MSFEIIALSCALLIGGLYAIVYLMYHKLSLAISQITKQTNKQANNVISQIEALLALYAEVRPEHSFPPTRGWAASPDFLRILTQMVIEEHPTTVVECSSGLSTLILAACLNRQGQGHVYSLENDPVFAAKTRDMLQLHSLGAWATVIDAPLKSLSIPYWEGKWYDTVALPSDITIDMLVIDGPPHFTSPLARYPALPILGNKIKPGGIVLLDDADREGEKRVGTLWLQNTPGHSKIEGLTAEKGVLGIRLASN